MRWVLDPYSVVPPWFPVLSVFQYFDPERRVVSNGSSGRSYAAGSFPVSTRFARPANPVPA